MFGPLHGFVSSLCPSPSLYLLSQSCLHVYLPVWLLNYVARCFRPLLCHPGSSLCSLYFSLRLSVCSWCFLFYSDSSFHPVCVMFSLAPSVSSVRSCLCTQVFPLSPDSLSYIFSVSLRPVSESSSGHVSCWYFNSFCYSHICLPHTGYPDTPS